MTRHTELTKENLESLLRWLGPDREAAGERFENVRERLVRFFEFRGCSDPCGLTDETMSRVASKADTLDPEWATKPERIFFGYASKIHLEYLSRWKHREVDLPPNAGAAGPGPAHPADSSDEDPLDCLDGCLERLPATESDLILKYYSEEKAAKLAVRRELADRLGMSVTTLHTKVYRIRNALKGCIEHCLGGNHS